MKITESRITIENLAEWWAMASWLQGVVERGVFPPVEDTPWLAEWFALHPQFGPKERFGLAIATVLPGQVGLALSRFAQGWVTSQPAD